MLKPYLLPENILFDIENGIKNNINLKPGMRILDLGCGKAISSIFMEQLKSIVS